MALDYTPSGNWLEAIAVTEHNYIVASPSEREQLWVCGMLFVVVISPPYVDFWK